MTYTRRGFLAGTAALSLATDRAQRNCAVTSLGGGTVEPRGDGAGLYPNLPRDTSFVPAVRSEDRELV